jgi:tRNA(fMet)-specific endonuclease VapC
MQHGPEDIKIPVIVKTELLYGAAKSNKRKENEKNITRFLEPFEIVPFDDSATVCYADIRSKAEVKGAPVGPNDLIIAATVLSQNGVLVTNNTKEFQRIEELMIENWVKE